MITPEAYTTSRGEARWKVRYREGRTARSKTFTDARGAQQFARLIDTLGPAGAVEVLAERNGAAADGVPTLTAWADHYIEHLTGVTEGTRSRYRLIVRQLGPMAHLPLDAITPDSIKRWVNRMTAEGLAGKTMANRHGFLSGLFKAAVHAGHIASSPCEGTRLPKTERQEMCFLLPGEFATLLAHVRPDAQDLVACLPSTGLRWGEVSALQARDVDLDAGTLTVSRAWKWTDSKVRTLGPPKTQRSRRTIALPTQTLDILARLLRDRSGEDFLFVNSAGRPWTGSRFHEAVWQPAVKAAAPELGKRPRVHDMRHTCASWMIRAGVPLPVIQRHLGHESIQTTIDRYGHMEPAHLAMAATALSGAMTNALPQIEG